MDQTRKSLQLTVDQRRIALACLLHGYINTMRLDFLEVHDLYYTFCHRSTLQTEHPLVLFFRWIPFFFLELTLRQALGSMGNLGFS